MLTCAPLFVKATPPGLKQYRLIIDESLQTARRVELKPPAMRLMVNLRTERRRVLIHCLGFGFADIAPPTRWVQFHSRLRSTSRMQGEMRDLCAADMFFQSSDHHSARVVDSVPAYASTFGRRWEGRPGWSMCSLLPINNDVRKR